MPKPILTLTLNPSVDISYPLNHLELDTVNRVSTTRKTAGGKGLNVARVIAQLGQKVAGSGFLGGDLGNFIAKKLSGDNIENWFMQISGTTTENKRKFLKAARKSRQRKQTISLITLKNILTKSIS